MLLSRVISLETLVVLEIGDSIGDMGGGWWTVG